MFLRLNLLRSTMSASAPVVYSLRYRGDAPRAIEGRSRIPASTSVMLRPGKPSAATRADHALPRVSVASAHSAGENSPGRAVTRTGPRNKDLRHEPYYRPRLVEPTWPRRTQTKSPSRMTFAKTVCCRARVDELEVDFRELASDVAELHEIVTELSDRSGR